MDNLDLEPPSFGWTFGGPGATEEERSSSLSSAGREGMLYRMFRSRGGQKSHRDLQWVVCQMGKCKEVESR
ncbi:hypothetical protein KC316_g7 [Hortaea werneckii]|nr:hypothetical protein KC316_g7 [Hortaea werneckii]